MMGNIVKIIMQRYDYALLAWKEYRVPSWKELWLCVRYLPNIVIGGPLFTEIWKTELCDKWAEAGEMKRRNSALEWDWKVTAEVDSGDKDWYYLNRNWDSKEFDKSKLSQKDAWDISMIDIKGMRSANRIIFDINIYFSKKAKFNGEAMKAVATFLFFICSMLLVIDMEPRMPPVMWAHWTTTITWLNENVFFREMETFFWVMTAVTALSIFKDPLYVVRSILRIDEILADELREIELCCFSQIPALKEVRNAKDSDNLKKMVGINSLEIGKKCIVAL